MFSAHNTTFPNGYSTNCLGNPPKDPSGKIVHNASEPSPSDRWGAVLGRTAIPGQTHDRTTGQDQWSVIGGQWSVERPSTAPATTHHPRHTRPETHQNLIHSCKEQHGHARQTAGRNRSNGATAHPGRYAQTHAHTELKHSAILVVSCHRPSAAVVASLLTDP